MNIEIGKKIRELRAEKLVTQEQLAVFLGVTPQAISRWESKYSYPDLELIPSIAEYFSVTTDELLGVNKTERELRLAEIKNEIVRLNDIGSTDEIIAYARQAVAEFPSDEELQLNLATSLQNLIWTNPNEALLNEAELILQTILETTKDIDVKCQAIRGLVVHYSYWHKNDARALEMANRLPSIKDCREFAKAWHIKNNTGSYLQQAIEKCAEYLTVNVKELVLDVELPDDESKWERKVKMLQTANDITRLIFGDDMMYHHSEVSYNYKHMAVYQLALGQTDDALTSLEKMTEHAIAFDLSYVNDRGKRFASPFVSALVNDEENSEFPKALEHNQCWNTLELIADKRFDCIRSNKRFNAIVQKLEHNAK